MSTVARKVSAKSRKKLMANSISIGGELDGKPWTPNRQKGPVSSAYLCDSSTEDHRATQRLTPRSRAAFAASTPAGSFRRDRFHDHIPTGAATPARSTAL